MTSPAEKLLEVARARVARRLVATNVTGELGVSASFGPVLKEDDEMRFTLAPLYLAGVEDAHEEYADGRELQEAVHGYMMSGDLRLRLMHDDRRGAKTIGHIVEMFALPWPIEVPILRPDGTEDSEKLPAGTVLTGVRWDESAWPAVKDGRIGGLSLGGIAVRARGDAVPTRGSLGDGFVRVPG